MPTREPHDVTACPDDDVLRRIASGQPCGPGTEAHVAGCARCARRLAACPGLDAFLAEVAVAERNRPKIAAAPALVVVPGYSIAGEISRGGQGVVYRAIQIQTKRRVALKVLLRGAFASARERARFEREVEIAAALRHPNIVTVFEARTLAEGGLALAMEYVEGVPVDEWVRAGVRAGARAEARRRALVLLVRIARAVGHAHQRGIIHRDLKPSNVLVDAENEPHILDFGLARLQEAVPADLMGSDSDAGVATDANPALSITGVFQGTPAYASPEQCAALAGQIDTRTDVYSLGVMAYEVVTGSLPHAELGSSTIAFNSRRSGAPALSPVVAARRVGAPDVHPDLAAVLMRALAPDPEDRYQSVEAFAADLEAVLSGDAVAARAHEGWYRVRKTVRRYRVPFAIVGLFFAVVSAAAWVFSRQSGELARRAESLSSALERSAVEQARAMVRAGHVPRAEQLLWPALLRADPDATLSNAAAIPEDAGFVGPPEQLHAYWAIWELLARHPCRATAAIGLERGGLAYPVDGALVQIHNSGLLRRLSIPDLDSTSVAGRAAVRLPTLPMFFAFSYSVGGSGLAVATAQGGFRVQSLVTGETVAEFVHPGKIITAQLGHDERRVYWVVDDSLMVNELGAEGAPRVLLDGLRNRAANPDVSNWCLMGSDDCFMRREPDGSVSVWNLRTMEMESIPPVPGSPLDRIRQREPASGSAFWAAARSPDGRWLALLINRDVLLVDRWSHDSQLRLEGSPTRSRGQLSFSDDGRWLTCGGFGQRVLVWSLPSGRLAHTWAGHTTAIDRPEFVPRSPWLATRDYDAVKLWDLDASDAWCAALSDGPGYSSLEVRFDASGRRLAAVGDDGAVRIWTRSGDGRSARENWGSPLVIPGGRVESSSLDFSSDGEMLVFAGHDGVVRVRRSWDGQEVARFDAGTERVECVRFMPDGGSLVWGRNDGIIEIAPIAGGSARRFPGNPPGETPRRIAQLAVTTDGKTVFVTFAAGSVRQGSVVAAFSIAEGRMLWRVSVPLPMRAIALAPDGRTLAVSCDDNRVRLLSAADGSLVRLMEGVATRAYGLAFHPLGKLLFSAHLSGELAIWDLRTGDAIASFLAHDGSAYSVAVSPDGTLLATSGEAAGVAGPAFASAADAPDHPKDAGLVRTWDLTYFRPHLAANMRYWRSQVTGPDSKIATPFVDGE
ncbi:MAG: protein kinase [Phycisphaerae bacterium]|nr:protein kinase [Phycisphaerae bacterium]